MLPSLSLAPKLIANFSAWLIWENCPRDKKATFLSVTCYLSPSFALKYTYLKAVQSGSISFYIEKSY